jgi:hypothetical protein
VQIDQITIALRPRSSWEAIDLGFGLARLWWPRLLFSWLLLALPVAAISALIFYDNPFVASLIFWWCKPLYEQIQLYFISRAIFREAPDSKTLVRELPRHAMRQVIANLTWRRFNINRSFNAPVAQLEGLKGKQRRQRLQVLSGSSNIGGWLTVVCIHFEAILYMSLIMLVWMLVPFEIDFTQWINEHETLVTWGVYFAYFAGVAVIAPFYVVGGFSLYINRRTHLEGWDIELAFKRIQERRGKRQNGSIAALLLLAITMTTVGSLFNNDVIAAEPVDTGEQTLVKPDEARDIINEVLSANDFGEKKQVTTWKLKDTFKAEQDTPDDTNVSALVHLFNFIANIGYYLVWALVGLLVVWVIYQFPKWKNALQFGADNGDARQTLKPQSVFGLEISEASLPDNIAEQAWQLFTANQPRQALSLLYRGSLNVLINRYGIIVKDSDTEGECARQVAQHQSQLADFFSALTRAWIHMAYGHQAPSTDAMKQLCDQWDSHFKGVNP